MTHADLYERYCALVDEMSELQLHQDEGSDEYGEKLEQLKAIAETGAVEAAGALAEFLALPGPRHDPEQAYRWYLIALAAEGFSTQYQNKFDDGVNYLGPVGEFRNEAMVSSLIGRLGLQRIQELDLEAEQWRRSDPAVFLDPRD